MNGSVEDQYGFQPSKLVSNSKGLLYSDTSQLLLFSGLGPCFSNNFYSVCVNSVAKQRKTQTYFRKHVTVKHCSIRNPLDVIKISVINIWYLKTKQMFLPICLPSSSRTEIPKGTWTSQSFPFSPFRALTLGEIKPGLVT